MEHTSPSTGRIGLLATPLVLAALALALSACGTLAPTGSSAPSSSSAPSGTSAANGTSASSGTPASSGASEAAFCEIWQETRTTLSAMNAILPGGTYSTSTPASELLPTMQAINSIFGRLVQVAPADISADMATLASFWSQVVADFQYGTTIGQVKAYITAHPPAQSATVTAAVQHLTDYLSTTCHIDMSS